MLQCIQMMDARGSTRENKTSRRAPSQAGRLIEGRKGVAFCCSEVCRCSSIGYALQDIRDGTCFVGQLQDIRDS